LGLDASFAAVVQQFSQYNTVWERVLLKPIFSQVFLLELRNFKSFISELIDGKFQMLNHQLHHGAILIIIAAIP